MNKNYVYKDGKVVIIDENGNQKEVDYYDNLNEVLVKENIIETIEQEIKQLEYEISSSKDLSKFVKWLNILFPFFATTIIATILIWLFSASMGPNSLFTVLSCYGYLSGSGAIFSLCEYIKEKKLVREQKGKETQLEYLEKDLEDLKEEIKQLKLDKTNSKKLEEFSISKVDSKEELKGLREYLTFYYNLGYNEQKYFKYYQQGKVYDKLNRSITDLGIEFINNHFEEKGPTLVKKRK